MNNNMLPPLKPSKPEKKPISKATKKRAIGLVFTTIGTMALYYVLLTVADNNESAFLAYFTMGGYAVILGVTAIIYLIYNKGFAYKNITPDMLPEEWSEERKAEVIDSAKIRLGKSKWMLMIIFAILITFVSDALYLFVWEGIIAPML